MSIEKKSELINANKGDQMFLPKYDSMLEGISYPKIFDSRPKNKCSLKMRSYTNSHKSVCACVFSTLAQFEVQKLNLIYFNFKINFALLTFRISKNHVNATNIKYFLIK